MQKANLSETTIWTNSWSRAMFCIATIPNNHGYSVLIAHNIWQRFYNPRQWSRLYNHGRWSVVLSVIAQPLWLKNTNSYIQGITYIHSKYLMEKMNGQHIDPMFDIPSGKFFIINQSLRKFKDGVRTRYVVINSCTMPSIFTWYYISELYCVYYSCWGKMRANPSYLWLLPRVRRENIWRHKLSAEAKFLYIWSRWIGLTTRWSLAYFHCIMRELFWWWCHITYKCSYPFFGKFCF